MNQIQKQITTNELQGGTIIKVTGTLSYSKLAKQIAGEELQMDIKRRKEQGRPVIEKPHTTATITNGVVHYADPNNPSLAEKYMMQRIKTNDNNPGVTYCTIDNKGKFLPAVYELIDNVATQIRLTNELAAGQKVTLIAKVFESKPYNGVALEAVVVHGEAKFFGSSGGANAMSKVLSDMGLTVNTLPAEPVVNAGPTPETAPISTESVFGGTSVQTQPVATQQPAVQSNPFTNTAPAATQQPAEQSNPFENTNTNGGICVDNFQGE